MRVRPRRGWLVVRGGGGADPANVLGRLSTAKSNVLAFWESPSAGLSKQANDAKAALPKAISEANALLATAAKVGAALKPFDIAFTVPAAVP